MIKLVRSGLDFYEEINRGCSVQEILVVDINLNLGSEASARRYDALP